MPGGRRAAVRLRYAVAACLAVGFWPAVAGGQARRNVVSGTVLSLDVERATVAVKTASGGALGFAVGEATRLLRGKRAAKLSDFAVGEAVTARYRPGTSQPYALHDLADRASWDWIGRLRADVTEVTLRELTDGALVADEGTDAAPVRYRVTATTAWRKAGRPALPADFSPGERLWVAPRMLPRGDIMAVGVSDTRKGAEGLRERSRPTVTGRLTAVDVPGAKATVVSASGEVHEAAWTAPPIVRRDGRDLSLSALKPGLWVTAHLKRDGDGGRLLTRLTVHAKAPAESRPGTGKTAPVRSKPL